MKRAPREGAPKIRCFYQTGTKFSTLFQGLPDFLGLNQPNPLNRHVKFPLKSIKEHKVSTYLWFAEMYNGNNYAGQLSCAATQTYIHSVIQSMSPSPADASNFTLLYHKLVFLLHRNDHETAGHFLLPSANKPKPWLAQPTIWKFKNSP